MTDGWQSIDMAPKDGTPCVIFDPDDETYNEQTAKKISDGVIAIAAWSNRFGVGYKWYDYTSDIGSYTPTHWRPLEPPK